MKKVFFMMSLALMAFVVTSCNNEDDFVQEVQKDQPLTTENIQSVKNFAKSFARFHKNVTPVVEKRMARTRSTASDNQHDLDAIQQQADILGESAQQMLMEIGFSEQELNELCPLENTDMYAIVGIQLLDAMADGMPEIVDDCPLEPGVDEMIEFNLEEQVQYAGECLEEALCLDLINEFKDELIPLLAEGGNTISKKVFMEAAERAVKKTVYKLSGKIAGGAASILVDWGICMVRKNL